MKASGQQKQLNIRSDEAYETARRLSKRLGMPTQEVVVRALRRMEDENRISAERLPPEVIEANLERLDAGRRAMWGGKEPPPGLTSDHDWLYDENGLPK